MPDLKSSSSPVTGLNIELIRQHSEFCICASCKHTVAFLASIVSGDTVNVKRSEIAALDAVLAEIWETEEDEYSRLQLMRKASGFIEDWLATPATQEDT